MKFRPVELNIFMGGDFIIEPPKTVKDFKRQIGDILSCLDGWDEDAVISEVHMNGRVISVTLSQGTTTQFCGLNLQ